MSVVEEDEFEVADNASSLLPSPIPSAPVSPREQEQEQERPQLGSLYEELQVPQLINQIQLRNTFSHVPPHMEELHSHTHSDVETSASNAVAELDFAANEGVFAFEGRNLAISAHPSEDCHLLGEFAIGELALDQLSVCATSASPSPKARMTSTLRSPSAAAARSPRGTGTAVRTGSDAIAEEVQRSGALVALMNQAAERRAALAKAKSARASLMVGNNRKAFAAGFGALAGQFSSLRRNQHTTADAAAARFTRHTGKLEASNGGEKNKQCDGDEKEGGWVEDEDDKCEDTDEDEAGSMCGFEEEEENCDNVDNNSLPSRQVRSKVSAAVVSEKTAQRGKFMKKFTQAVFRGDKAAQAKAKVDEVFKQNKELVEKAMAQETLKLVDPAMNIQLQLAKQRDAAAGYANFIVVREALAISASIRSKASRDLITDMFKYGCALSPYMAQCSDRDLLALSESVELREIKPSSRKSDLLHVRGEVALHIYIIMHGSLKVAVYPTEGEFSTGAGEQAAAVPTEFRLLSAGDCLGEFILHGETSWNVDVHNPSASHVSLCCIPLDTALRYIGRKGPDAEGAMVLFWKHHRLWQEIKRHNHDLLLHTKYKHAATGNPKKRQDIHFNFQPMNVIDSGRIKVLQPGMDIFTQGAPRHYLYLMLRGCAEYRRAFPPAITAGGLMPPNVEVGLTLLCGDFSFMDGEDHLWIEQMQEMDAQVTGSASDSDRVRERRMRTYCRFDTHKNSLVAVSRVEVLLVPIHEVAKCIKLFQRLIRLATEKYPTAFIASEELVRQHYEAEKWQIDRKEVIKDIINEQEARQLSESWFQSVHNNVADDWYVARQPGRKTTKSTLQMIMEASSSSALPSPARSAKSTGNSEFSISVSASLDSDKVRASGQGSGKSTAPVTPTRLKAELESPRRALLKSCVDYIAAEESRAKSVLEMASNSAKLEVPSRKNFFPESDESVEEEKEKEPADYVTVTPTRTTPRPPQSQLRPSSAPGLSLRRFRSANGTSSATVDNSSTGTRVVRCEDAPNEWKRRPQSAQQQVVEGIHSSQRPRSASNSGASGRRSRPFSANLAVRASVLVDDGHRVVEALSSKREPFPARSCAFATAPLMAAASSPRPHTTGSHRHLVEAHSTSDKSQLELKPLHLQPQSHIPRPSQPQPQPQPQPKSRSDGSSGSTKKVVQFSKLLPMFDFSNFACGDDHTGGGNGNSEEDDDTAAVERREGSMKNPQFAEYDFTSAMLISASAKRQAQRVEEEKLSQKEMERRQSGSRNHNNSAGVLMSAERRPSASAVSRKQRVHQQRAKSREIDPERFVQAYRDKLIDDPHKRFVDEFIKK